LGNCTGLTSITIPNSVTSIGSYAFCDCRCLTSITILAAITTVPRYAFYGCDSLLNVELPNTVETIGLLAFKDCKALRSIRIPGSVKKIEESAFAGCNNIVSFVIPASVTSIDEYAFQYCTGICYFEFKGDVVAESKKVFLNNTKLDRVFVRGDASGWGDTWCDIPVVAATVSAALNSDGTSYSFGVSGASLQGSFVVPPYYNGLPVTTISESAFSGQSGLTGVELPESTTKVLSSAFSNCTGLTSITIPNSVTSIGGSAFSGCTGLIEITIPASVTSIGDYAFSNCTGLLFFKFDGARMPEAAGVFDGASALELVFVNDGVSGWGDTWGGMGLWIDYTDLLSFTPLDDDPSCYFVEGKVTFTQAKPFAIPPVHDGHVVKKIGDYAFNYFFATTIFITKATTIIGDGAFANCRYLTSINIHDSVESFEGSVFYGCNEVESISVSSGNPTYYSEGNCCIERSTGTLVFGCKNSVIPTSEVLRLLPFPTL